MAVSFVCLVLFVVVFPTNQAVSDSCPYGEYWFESQCWTCSACPIDTLRGFGNHNPIHACRIHDSLCPNWCSVQTPVTARDRSEAKDLCRNYWTPTPPVPFVNVTVDDPVYDTANAYTISCRVFFQNMDAPTLEWTDPSGRVLPPTDTSDKFSVQRGELTEGATSQEVTFHIKDFQREDEGNYTCSVQGEPSANRSVLLKYVEPPVTTVAPSTAPSTYPPGDATPTSYKSATPRDQWDTWVIILVVIIIALVIVVCARVAWGAIRRKNRFSPSIGDFESHPLTGVPDRLCLRESDDFKSATAVGIQDCFDQLSCDSVIIKHKNKKHTVQRGQDEFYIESMSWKYGVEVFAKYSGKKKKQSIRILKMKCLRVENITETSAVVRCPSDENTFFYHFEEKTSDGGSSYPGRGELMTSGSKEICNLRPDITYSVLLGVRGISGVMNWSWQETFKTRSVKFELEAPPGESSARLRLTGTSIPESLQLYYKFSDVSEPRRMTSEEVQIQSLIPGMPQVVQIMVKEDVGESTSYRLLDKISFKTKEKKGSVTNGGNYVGYATTDFPATDADNDEPHEPPAGRGKRKKKQKQNSPQTCDTGLLEAIHNIRDNVKFQDLYYHLPQRVRKAVLESLVEFLKDFKKIDASLPPRSQGLEDIEKFIKQLAMQDYTGVFDLLRRYIHKSDVCSLEGINFAQSLIDVHEKNCNLCRHTLYLLKCYEKKDTS